MGLRVVRGPDWEWEDQDGGEGFVGTVVELEEGGVIVQWDVGQRFRYRCGRDNKFDLRVFDSGPVPSEFFFRLPSYIELWSPRVSANNRS